LTNWKGPRFDNSGREKWSKVRILNALKNVAPNGLGFNALLERIQKSAEEAKIPKMSSRTLSNNLPNLCAHGLIAKTYGLYYINQRGFQGLNYLTDTRRYEEMLNDPTTILIGQKPDPRESKCKSYTVIARAEKSENPLDEQTQQEVEKVTNDMLEQVWNLLATRNIHEIKIQATIISKKSKDILSAYRYALE